MSALQRLEAPPTPAGEEEWLIVDKLVPAPFTDAQGRNIDQPRVHELPYGDGIMALRFHYYKPTLVPESLAMLLLKDKSFIRINEKGEIIPFKNPPKQPEQLQAGERIELAADEVIANLSELTAEALKVRALQIPGGEVVKSVGKADVIAFIVANRKTTGPREVPSAQAANAPGVELEEFTPEAEGEDGFFQE